MGPLASGLRFLYRQLVSFRMFAGRLGLGLPRAHPSQRASDAQQSAPGDDYAAADRTPLISGVPTKPVPKICKLRFASLGQFRQLVSNFIDKTN